jgi:hypothetical protein
MAQLLVRNLDPAVKEALQRRAQRHGRSMEEEVRLILRPRWRARSRRRGGRWGWTASRHGPGPRALLATGHVDRFLCTAIGLIDPFAF